MRVIVTSSNNLVSKGLTSLLAHDEGLRVFTLNGPSPDSTAIKEMQPDVLITDFPTLLNIPKAPPVQAKVLLLDTGCSKDEINYAFIFRQVSGVIDAGADERLLLKAIKTVAGGRLWISRKAVKNLLEELRASAKSGELSDPEKKILLICEKEAGGGFAPGLRSIGKTLSSWLGRTRKKSGGQNAGKFEKPALLVLLARLLQKFFSMVTL